MVDQYTSFIKVEMQHAEIISFQSMFCIEVELTILIESQHGFDHSWSKTAKHLNHYPSTKQLAIKSNQNCL